MKLNLNTVRDWSAVITDVLYGLLSNVIFLALIPALVERKALTFPVGLALGVFFAALGGAHLATAALNAIAIRKVAR